MLHLFLNCFWATGEGMSGGDKRFVEFFKRWQKLQIGMQLHTTHQFAEILYNEGVDKINIIYSDTEKRNNNGIIRTYIKRTIKSYCNIKNVKDGDVFYSTTDILPDILPAYFIKKKKKSSVEWKAIIHHIYESYRERPGNKVKNWISCMQQKFALNLMKRHADQVLIESPLVYDYLKEHKWDLSKLVWTSNGVDAELINSVNEINEKYEACFLGRLSYSKGIMELPIIWKKVVDKVPTAKLIIMGNGRDEIKTQLKNEIKKYGLEHNIVMTGYLSTDKIYATMKSSKIFLFTSHEEGWGIAIAEAMACGLPVVAYDLPIYRYIFKKKIVTCSFKNVDEMSSQTIDLLQNSDKAADLGKECKKMIFENYSWDAVADREVKLIMNLPVQKWGLEEMQC